MAATVAAKGCPKCNATMQPGFVVDHTHGAYAVSTWHEGAPVKSFWTGVKLSKAKQLPVQTLRCPRCGFLESYAIGE